MFQSSNDDISSMSDSDFLKQALLIAEYSPEEVACGAVLVMNGEVVAKAFNSQHADALVINHAEVKLIQLASNGLKRRTFEGATVYCTCEPCAMCLAALSYAKVQRIVYDKSMAEVFPADRQAAFDSQAFVRTLNFVPELEQLAISK
jgi:tRNA(Arg) A34 adenosine deaminase TadA